MELLKKYLFALLPLFAFYFSSHAQVSLSVIDSLKLAFKNAKHDTTRCSILNAMIEAESDDTVWPEYNDRLFKLAEKNTSASSPLLKKNYLTHMANALNNMGYLAEQQGNIAKALEFDQRSLKIQEEIKNKKGIATCLNNIGVIYYGQGNIPTALKYYHQSVKIQEEMGDKAGLTTALTNIGLIYGKQGETQKAMGYFNKSLKLQEEIQDKLGIANTLNNMAIIYENQGDIPTALECYHKNLKIQEEMKDKTGMAISLMNIGIVYRKQNDFPKALVYFMKGLKLKEDLKDKSGAARALNNIGVLYFQQGNTKKALEYYERNLKIQEEMNDRSGIAYSLNNIGTVYSKQNQFEKALACFTTGLKLREDIKDKGGVSTTLNNIASLMLTMGKATEAFNYAKRSLVLAKELNYPENIRNAEYSLALANEATKNYSDAFAHYKQYVIYRDSINNETTRKASIKSELKYDYEKKEAVIKEQQEKERAIAEEKNRFQQIVILSVIIGLALVIVFAAFVFRSLSITRKQKIIIEVKQKEILDSIKYARRIQQSLLPQEKYIEKNLLPLKNKS